MNEKLDRELDWEDSIETDSEGFVLAPEGDYDFYVSNFERARHAGSAKLPPCNKAVIYVTVNTPEGETTIRDQLFLHTKTEGMLSAFFRAIGQKQHGEKVQMDWSKVLGARGRCKVGVRTWTGADGQDRTSNEIKKYYDAADVPTGQPAFRRGQF